MMNPKEVGERSEGQILAAFLRAGRVVLMPFGDSQRYDMVLDEGGGKFLRIQCKTGKIKNGAILFPTCSNNWNTGERRDYRGQIDLFAVYEPTTDKIYLVPVDDVGIKTASLRISASKNGQTKGTRIASDYEFNS